MAKKVRKIGTIWGNLRVFLNPAKPQVVKQKEAMSKYRGGGMSSQAAHVVALNKHPPFRKDKLSLRPQDVPPNASVGQLLVALVIEYEDNGWDVVK